MSPRVVVLAIRENSVDRGAANGPWSTMCLARPGSRVSSPLAMAADSLEAITDRLASPAAGRTEADIQSDVRKLLLDAPLELADPSVIDIKLEAQAGGGRRIDVEAGCAAIEVKRSIESRTVYDRAVEQLTGYVVQRTEERGQRYVGVLTDGRSWVLFHLTPAKVLAEVSRLQIRSASDASTLVAWLDHILATTSHAKPTQSEIVRRLGAGSPGFALDLADLTSLYAACERDPEVRLKRELWARLLSAALGTNFEDSDELFVAHTYLVLTAELLAHAVVGISVDDPTINVRDLIEGTRFDLAGLHGVVEADFFDWPATSPDGLPIIRGIARRLARFDWSAVDHDVLKALYESVIDPDTRHKLGEYYTPDWLADRMVRQVFTDPLNQRILDPACGSGTFLFWAIRRLIAAGEELGLTNREIVSRVARQVNGIDLHPVAVTLARVTYLLALGPERLQDRDEITIPVWLGDSVRWEQDESLLAGGGITIRTADSLELIEQELHFPEGVVQDPARFDRLVADLADRASRRRPGTKPPGIGGLLNRHHVLDQRDRQAVELVFARLCGLHDHGRDHIWGYYIRNLARPLAFTRPEGRVDVLVGNPPWLAYRHMPARLQQTYKRLAQERGLWEGGKSATHQDLSDLFVARAVEQYLKAGGVFAFVMPYAVLSRRQFAGFRNADWSSQLGGVSQVRFDEPEGFSGVKPPLFPVPPCVVQGSKARRPSRLPRSGRVWTGRVASHHATWPEVEPQLNLTVGDVDAIDDDLPGSPYRPRFAQGAIFAPRLLVSVEPVDAGPLGVIAGHREVRSSRSRLERRPWRYLPPLHGVVEEEFVHPTLSGTGLVAFRLRRFEHAVLPIVRDRLIDGATEALDEYNGLATWWREAERVWTRNKAASTRLTLREQLNFQGKLERQLPVPSHRVVYTTSGQYLAAARLEDSTVLVDSSLYWAPTSGSDEALYLVGVLNSRPLADVVRPMQSRGEHNPRHFHLLPVSVWFPTFDPDDPDHQEIVAVAARAEHLVANIAFDPTRRFEVARRVTREALDSSGLEAELAAAVERVLGPSFIADELDAAGTAATS